MNKPFIIAVFLFTSTFSYCQTSSQHQQEDYGLSQENPVLVGTENLKDGPGNERAYLDQLSGPNGEPIEYTRTGSCCQFETENGPLGGGMLDMYELTYQGLAEPVILYLNMYDPDPDGEIQAPNGFILKE